MSVIIFYVMVNTKRKQRVKVSKFKRVLGSLEIYIKRLVITARVNYISTPNVVTKKTINGCELSWADYFSRNIE